jgi:hypothetical protein
VVVRDKVIYSHKFPHLGTGTICHINMMGAPPANRVLDVNEGLDEGGPLAGVQLGYAPIL